MRHGPHTPVPWDLIVFFTITVAGFGLSVQKIIHPETSEAPVTTFSLQTSTEEAVPVAAHRSILELGCVGRKYRRAITNDGGGPVRLRGKFCHLPPQAMRKLAGLRLRNLTTEKEGTVFLYNADSTFITDDLSLRPGKNRIQLEWRENDGSDLKTYVTEVYE